VTSIHDLLDDPAVLKQLVVKARQEYDVERKRAAFFEREFQRLAQQIFGRRSERLVGESKAQIQLFDAGDGETTTAGADASESDAPLRRKRKGGGGGKGRGGRDELPAHLERIEVTSDDPGPTTCGNCGGALKVIGQDKTERLERIPAQFKVLVCVRNKYVCPCCPSEGVVTQPAPPFALERSKYADGFLAQVLTDKFADNIPLQRQVKRFGREGVDVPVSALSRIVGSTADLLKHVVAVIADELRAGPFLQGDATGMPILVGEGNAAHPGALWVYTDGEQAVFEATLSHERAHPARFLDGFEGVFLPDGASTFNAACEPDAVERAGCWAHARRKFFEARDGNPAAHEALVMIRDLFLVERDAWQVDAEQRQRMRDTRSRLIIGKLRTWVRDHLAEADPSSPFHKALSYTNNQWDRLVVFLNHPEVPIHNNTSERALRGPVTGRKNWLFAGSADGAESAATHFSIVTSCMMVGIDPFDYLRDVLHRLPDATPTVLRQLTPRAWAARA
jgi:transposase